MNVFLFGAGYTALHFIAKFGNAFCEISGTVRSAEKRERLRPLDVDLFDGFILKTETMAKVKQADIILISVPPSTSGDPVLNAFGETIATANARRVIYLSTIGVYGDHGGAWIDETATPRPILDRAIRRLRAEASWLELLGDRLAVLRLAGIYGPGRNALIDIRDGKFRRIVKPGQVFNRIHVDDATRAILGAGLSECGGAWNVSDDEPAPPQDVISYAATLMGISLPPEEAFETADLTPMARSFYASNKRILNARFKHDLKVELAFPNYREGLKHLWNAGEGRVKPAASET
jgi:nucleoside-diphosphate-sugar epimerase